MIFLVTVFLTFLADAASKALIQRSLYPHETVPIIRNFFHLTYVRNKGAAFGIFPGQQGLFVGFSIVAIVFFTLYYLLRRPKRAGLTITLGLIVGGTLGNLADRWGNQTVTDFLDLQIWPVFNLADVAIVVGTALLIVEFVRKD